MKTLEQMRAAKVAAERAAREVEDNVVALDLSTQATALDRTKCRAAYQRHYVDHGTFGTPPECTVTLKKCPYRAESIKKRLETNHPDLTLDLNAYGRWDEYATEQCSVRIRPEALFEKE